MNRLKRAAIKCDFGTHNDRALRDQFLAGLLNSTTRREILAKPPSDITTFQAVTKIAVARETALKAAAQITPATTATSSVNAVQRKKQARRSATRASSSRNKCYNCGKEGHISRDEHCPAKEHRCRKCQKNHLEEVCRSSRDKKSANCVTEDIDQDRDDFLALTISSADVANICSEASCTVNVRINGAEVEALVDSGSSVDVLGRMFCVVFASKERTLAWRIVRPASLRMGTRSFKSSGSFRQPSFMDPSPCPRTSSSSQEKDAACWDDRSRRDKGYSAPLLWKSTRQLRQRTSHRTCKRSSLTSSLA